MYILLWKMAKNMPRKLSDIPKQLKYLHDENNI